MRYPVGAGTPSQPIVDTGGEQYTVIITNAGAVDVWVEPEEGSGSSLIDKSDGQTGAPLAGHKIPPNSWPPLKIEKFNGKIYARTAAQNGAVNIWVVLNC
jgi:hypothetical protein